MAAQRGAANGWPAAARMCVAALLWSAAASAQPAATPPDASDFALPEPGCIEWTNLCRICTLTDAGAPACSNVGIACQPEAARCTRFREETKEEKK